MGGVVTSSAIFSANLVDCVKPANSSADSSSSEYREVLADSTDSLEWEQWLSKEELSSSSRMRVSATRVKPQVNIATCEWAKQTNGQTKGQTYFASAFSRDLAERCPPCPNQPWLHFHYLSGRAQDPVDGCKGVHSLMPDLGRLWSIADLLRLRPGFLQRCSSTR